MSALQSLLRPAASLINRQVTAKTPARALCAELDGRAFAMRVADTGLALYLVVADGAVVLTADYPGEPDVVATGSLLSLARLAGPAGERLIRTGAVDLAGDAVVASQFQKLLRYGRPDFEEELSAFVGDTAAHGIGTFVRGVGRWGRDAGATMEQNVGEYLKEESRAVPGRHEADAFRDRVNTLRDDVARFEARLRKLEEALR
ncbi:MAG: SCP2 sterol-binding domain-containing protein [Gammaproteobacteria bacterium]|nr:SCP2 sterol-binding domain-containing protein [Gammaproteobacteria bacterium]